MHHDISLVDWGSEGSPDRQARTVNVSHRVEDPQTSEKGKRGKASHVLAAFLGGGGK